MQNSNYSASKNDDEACPITVLSSTIGFDEAQRFYQTYGYGIKPAKWHDLTVEVYL